MNNSGKQDESLDVIDLLNADLDTIFEVIDKNYHSEAQKNTQTTNLPTVAKFELTAGPHLDRAIEKAKSIASMSLKYAGSLHRVTPYDEFSKKYDPATQALQRNLQKMGVPQVMPFFYANRMKRFIEMGFVEPGGHAFTHKGQKIAAQYLANQKNLDIEKALEVAQKARSRPLKLSKSQTPNISATSFRRREITGDLSFLQIDNDE